METFHLCRAKFKLVKAPERGDSYWHKKSESWHCAQGDDTVLATLLPHIAETETMALFKDREEVSPLIP